MINVASHMKKKAPPEQGLSETLAGTVRTSVVAVGEEMPVRWQITA
jgi:hypothetical protein